MLHIHRGGCPRITVEKFSMRSLLVALLGAIVLIAPAAHAEAQMRFGFVNSQALIREAPGTLAAEAQFQQEMQAPQAEIDRLELNLRRLMEAFQQQQGTLQPEARQARTAEIDARRAEFNERLMELEEEAGRRREELFAPIFEGIGEAIERIREEGSYDFIFDTAAGGILAANPDLDLTEVVLRTLQELTGTGGS